MTADQGVTADQGWAVDDGTCTRCLHGDCWACTKPSEGWSDEGLVRTCCCNEGVELWREASWEQPADADGEWEVLWP